MVPWENPLPTWGQLESRGWGAETLAAWEAFPAAEPLPEVGVAASSELNCSGQSWIPALEVAPPRQCASPPLLQV